ncbi:MAG TPA: lytic murein transglycosylase B [Azospira sp.]|nr:lytic murein transglycosylase B [Azospira sp.]
MKQALRRTAARLALFIPLLAASQAALAAKKAETFANDPEAAAFIAEMVERHGFSADSLAPLFAATGPNASVLSAIQPAATAERRSWQRYRERFVNEQRTRAGLAFWQRHGATIAKASAVYGVPEEIIVAIIGVETEYGRNTGRYSVFQALATLAFRYPPRAPFFRGELEQFLLLARENRQPPQSIKGSYAGAIGIPQFMPSSQRRFAVDFDGDGRIDLVGSPEDAIGSVASFLAQHGWQTGAPIAHPLPAGTEPAAELLQSDLTPRHSSAALRAAGLAAPGDSRYALVDLVTPDGPTEYWLGEQNFWVISRYNRSSFYAMAVFQLGERLRMEREAELAATR